MLIFNTELLLESKIDIATIKLMHAVLISAIANCIKEDKCNSIILHDKAYYNISPVMLKRECIFFNDMSTRHIRKLMYDLEDLHLLKQYGNNKQCKKAYFKVHRLLIKLAQI